MLPPNKIEQSDLVSSLQGVQKLRAEAEARLITRAKLLESAPRDAEELLHDLQVHQIELEMQNESLQHLQHTLETSSNRYLNLYEFAPVGYLIVTNVGLLGAMNLKSEAMLGVKRNAFLTRLRFAQFVADQDKDVWHRQFVSLKNAAVGSEKSFDLSMERSDGSSIHVNVYCQRMDEADNPQILRVVLTDITQRKLAENNLRIAATAFESQEGMMVTDADSHILRVNQAFTDITGYSADEVVGKTPHVLSSGRHDSAFYEAMWGGIHHTGQWKGEIWNRRKSGEVYPQYLTISSVKDTDGVTTNFVATLTDITESKNDAETIHHMALYDPLTNLPNRRLLIDRINHTLAASARLGWSCAILFIDIDHFKTVNDTLGHDTGDLLLQTVAERLTECVREGDTVARIGGDEFVVLLQDMSRQSIEAATQAEIIALKILTSLRRPYLAMHQHHVTASIGIALLSDHEHSQEDLLKHADIAMYQAKKAGRNNVCFFDPQMQIAINHRADLEQELRKAVEQRQFELHYQIQVDSAGRALGAEALIRWQHPERGMIYPVDFIELAEETGLILPIGEWVIETACAQLKAWEQGMTTRDLTLSVNVSAKQFRHGGFADQVKSIVLRHGIKPALLKLELTESMLVENIANIIAVMNDLKNIGIRFELDDFGTGYSSLQYLKKLPLHQLKIDQSFVRDLATDNGDQAIVRTIIAMAGSLNLEVIAEGVETDAQRQRLLTKGCTHYQGYLFGKPVPLKMFEASINF